MRNSDLNNKERFTGLTNISDVNPDDTGSLVSCGIFEGIGCASTVTFNKDVSVVRNYVRVNSVKDKTEPVKCTSLDCYASSPKFTNEVSVIKNYRHIARANRTYSGVYFATGEREKMYQPRKSPLNWIPQKWNGQDM